MEDVCWLGGAGGHMIVGYRSVNGSDPRHTQGINSSSVGPAQNEPALNGTVCRVKYMAFRAREQG